MAGRSQAGHRDRQRRGPAGSTSVARAADVELTDEQRDQIRFMHGRGGWDVRDIAIRLQIEFAAVAEVVAPQHPTPAVAANVQRVEGFG